MPGSPQPSTPQSVQQPQQQHQQSPPHHQQSHSSPVHSASSVFSPTVDDDTFGQLDSFGPQTPQPSHQGLPPSHHHHQQQQPQQQPLKQQQQPLQQQQQQPMHQQQQPMQPHQMPPPQQQQQPMPPRQLQPPQQQSTPSLYGHRAVAMPELRTMTAMPQSSSSNQYGASAYAQVWSATALPNNVASGGPPGNDDSGEQTSAPNEAVNFNGKVSYSLTISEVAKLKHAHRLIETATLSNPEGYNALFLDRHHCDHPQYLANAVSDELRACHDIFSHINVGNWLTVMSHLVLNPDSSKALAMLNSSSSSQQLNEQTGLRNSPPSYRDVSLSELMNRRMRSCVDASDEDLQASFSDEATTAVDNSANKRHAANEPDDGGNDAGVEAVPAPKAPAAIFNSESEYRTLLTDIIDEGALQLLEPLLPEDLEKLEAALWEQTVHLSTEKADDYQLEQPVADVQAALDLVNAGPPVLSPTDDIKFTAQPTLSASSDKTTSYNTQNPAPASSNWVDLESINGMVLPHQLPKEFEKLYELYKASMLEGLKLHPLTRDKKFSNLRPALSLCQTALAKALPMPLIMLAAEIEQPRSVIRHEASGKRRSLIGITVRLTKPVMSPVSWTFSDLYSSFSGQCLSADTFLGSVARSAGYSIEQRLDCRSMRKSDECVLPNGENVNLTAHNQRNKDFEYMAVLEFNKQLTGFAMKSNSIAWRVYASRFVAVRRADLLIDLQKTPAQRVDDQLREAMIDQWKVSCVRRGLPTMWLKKESSNPDHIITTMSELRQWANQVMNPRNRDRAAMGLIDIMKHKRSKQKAIIEEYRGQPVKRKLLIESDDEADAVSYGNSKRRRPVTVKSSRRGRE